MKPSTRYVSWPEGPIDGCKVEVLSKETDGTCKVKLLEPASTPAYKVGDHVTILVNQLRTRRF